MDPYIRTTWLGPARPDHVELEVETRLDPHLSLLFLIGNILTKKKRAAPAPVREAICSKTTTSMKTVQNERLFGGGSSLPVITPAARRIPDYPGRSGTTCRVPNF